MPVTPRSRERPTLPHALRGGFARHSQKPPCVPCQLNENVSSRLREEGPMAANPDVPPAQTIKPVSPPPPSDQPTTAMLKADIDSGRTGDKIGELDPGLSSLGTDDEAAGRPPSALRIALAQYHETIRRWAAGGRSAPTAHSGQDGGLRVFVGLIVAIGVVLLAGIW